MRLKETRIEYIAHKIYEQLIGDQYLECEDEAGTVALIRKVIHDDLRVEDLLDEEVRELLRQHQNTLDKSRVEYHQMFRLIKEKLVRERNLII
ncbi:DUF507 family protein [bacterium]|nr:DUF507 family protein [bacterium]